MFFFFLFIVDLYFLIPEVIAQIFIPNGKLVITTGTQANIANANIKKQLVTVEAQISKC